MCEVQASSPLPSRHALASSFVTSVIKHLARTCACSLLPEIATIRQKEGGACPCRGFINLPAHEINSIEFAHLANSVKDKSLYPKGSEGKTAQCLFNNAGDPRTNGVFDEWRKCEVLEVRCHRSYDWVPQKL